VQGQTQIPFGNDKQKKRNDKPKKQNDGNVGNDGIDG